MESDHSLASLTVMYMCITGHCSSTSKTKQIKVKFRLSDTVASFLVHLSASFNGVQSCSKGKELHLHLPDRKLKRIDQRRSVSLEFHGVKNNDCLELRGYRPISKKQYEYPFEVIDPDGRKVRVEVTNMTDMNALKHKLQNATGIHVSEIMLYCNGKSLPRHSLKTVEFYGGQSSSKVLKMQQAPAKLTEVSGRVMQAQQTTSIDSGSLSSTVDKDGPYHSNQDQPQKSLTLRYSDKSATVFQYPDEYLSRVPAYSISEIGLVEISKEKFGWKQLAIRLGITDGERQCIQHDNDKLEDIKLHMLLRWKENDGEAATWRKLQKAVLDERNRLLAEKIIELARKRKNSDETSPSPVLLSDEKPATKRPHSYTITEPESYQFSL